MSAKSRRWKTILTLFTLLALVGTIYLLRGELSQTIENLRHAYLWPILLVIPLAMTNHYFQGKLYQSLFHVVGNQFDVHHMMRLSLELNLINNVFPSGGVSGFSYLAMRMKEQGVPTGRSTFVQMLRFITIFISFQVLLGLGLLMLAFSGDANNFVMLVAGSLATLLLVGTAGMAFVIGDERRIHGFSGWLARAVNRLIHIVRPSNPETISLEKVKRALTELHECFVRIRGDLGQLRKPLGCALMITLAEVLAITSVFIAFGHIINPGAVIIAYAVANFAGIISVLPGGVGIYEGLMTGVFAAAGVSAAVSLPVVISYRIISMTVQLPPGYFFYQRALRAAPKE